MTPLFNPKKLTPDEQRKSDRDVKLLGKYADKGLSIGGALKRFDKFKAKHQNEDVFADSQAATQSNFDGANSPDNTEPQVSSRKKEMSKSARIIKSIYKRKGVTEELYDGEKEDKSVATYGKKPKMQKGVEGQDQQSLGDTTPQAAAVLKGGKTLTGQTRDTLEIDPMMRRPLRPDQKQADKKEINNK